MKSRNSRKVVTQGLNQSRTQLPAANQHIKSVSPMTFSQKLYQLNAIEIAEEYEQAIEANSLEKIKILLDKLIELEVTELGLSE